MRWGIVGVGGVIGGVVVGWFALLAILVLALVIAGPGGCEVTFDDDDDRNPALELAIAGCDVEGVERELVKGGDQFDGGTWELFGGDGPTMEEAVACGPEMATLLTRYAPRNDGGDTVLHAAVAVGDPVVALAVLGAGADVDARDDAGDTALLDAVTDGDGPMVELLLAAGADPSIGNEAGQTPLLRAIGFHRPLLVTRLLAAGADPNVVGSVTGLELLFVAGPEVDDEGRPVGTSPVRHAIDRLRPALGYPQDDPLPGISPLTPLYAAVVLSPDEVVLALLEAGADPTVGNGPAGHLPADAAELLGRTELAARIRAAAEAG